MVVTDPFTLQSQKSNETWIQGENYDSETGSGLEVTIPNALRPIHRKLFVEQRFWGAYSLDELVF